MRTLRLTDGRSYPPKVILRLSGRHRVKCKTVHAKAIGHRAPVRVEKERVVSDSLRYEDGIGHIAVISSFGLIQCFPCSSRHSPGSWESCPFTGEDKVGEGGHRSCFRFTSGIIVCMHFGKGIWGWGEEVR